ncbi:MAG: hypothetical protein EAZ32_13655 [Cytophagia bacterium]|nr:MAG: hypothetical protein EAZ46_08095 [Runella sp.]TAG23783.1 MAG: hypothetical protein EAZ38_02565 [Cytophagales bacterium]TAG37977.1 MAG: hypothetical protein EAZ32_13655 [Cytophagia bacterium]TAG51206.1 MAG: hypothetical protein EAZ29_10395 [Runella slithyformis]TAG76556.1 MAG: hypothetical protein EAZ22_17845 [Cytophagales bacterium]
MSTLEEKQEKKLKILNFKQWPNGAFNDVIERHFGVKIRPMVSCNLAVSASCAIFSRPLQHPPVFNHYH